MQEINLTAKLSTGGSVPPVIESKTITENGTYTAPTGIDGFNPVVVDIPGTPVIESKTITENGTYTAPFGVNGYNPVTVNVPLPSNAYLLNSVDTPTAIATFNDGEEMVMPTLKVAIEPQQEGSGDPSPTNIRPISGWDEANITVADDDTDPTISNVCTIDLDGTRYGGEVDVVSGVLKVDRVEVDMGSLSWANRNNNIFSTKLNDAPQGNPFSVICERYKTNNVDAGTLATLDYTLSTYPSYDYKTVMIRDSNYSTDTGFKNSLDGVKMVYELTTPLTIQLTPTAVKSLLGSNNVWADTGDILEYEYFSH